MRRKCTPSELLKFGSRPAAAVPSSTSWAVLQLNCFLLQLSELSVEFSYQLFKFSKEEQTVPIRAYTKDVLEKFVLIAHFKLSQLLVHFQQNFAMNVIVLKHVNVRLQADSS